MSFPSFLSIFVYLMSVFFNLLVLAEPKMTSKTFAEPQMASKKLCGTPTFKIKIIFNQTFFCPDFCPFVWSFFSLNTVLSWFYWKSGRFMDCKCTVFYYIKTVSKKFRYLAEPKNILAEPGGSTEPRLKNTALC